MWKFLAIQQILSFGLSKIELEKFNDKGINDTWKWINYERK